MAGTLMPTSLFREEEFSIQETRMGACRRFAELSVAGAEAAVVRAPALPAQPSGLLASDGGAPAPRRPAARTTSWGEASEVGRNPLRVS